MEKFFNAIDARELEQQVRDRKPYTIQLRRLLAEIELRIEGGAATFADLQIENRHVGDIADRLRDLGFSVEDPPRNHGAETFNYVRKRVSWGKR